MPRLPIASFVFASVLLLGSSASAQSLVPEEEAKARFETGIKYYDKEDFESARLAFAQAYAVLKRPSILLNLALSELYSNHPVEAIGHLEQYLGDRSTTADKRMTAQARLDEAMKKTGHLDLHASDGATVKVDGVEVDRSAPVVHVLPGPHAVEAKQGERRRTANVVAKAGETTRVELAFDAGESAPDPAPAPAVEAVPSPATEPAPPAPSRGSFWGLRSVGGLALAGVGVVALGTFVLFKSDEASESDRIRELGAGLAPDACAGPGAPPCGELADAVRARDDAASRATVSAVIGGVALGLGAALVASSFVWPHRASSRARIVPIAGPRQAGLAYTTSF